jgi:hypothetical protein
MVKHMLFIVHSIPKIVITAGFSAFLRQYSKTCLSRTPLGLDRCLVYTGSNYIDI